MLAASYMRDLYRRILQEPNSSATDIYNHWLMENALKMENAQKVFQMLNYIEILKKMEREKILILSRHV